MLACYVTISTGVTLLLLHTFVDYIWGEKARRREVRATEFDLELVVREAKWRLEEYKLTDTKYKFQIDDSKLYW